ncbi:MAG TPA: DUF1993 domain-containing protein [Burkholderiales bacterium]|nr:DUF1993 domain-containing protein [Burkholderiales bacterium]
MPSTLHDISVLNYAQLLDSIGSVLDKGLSCLREKGIALEDVVETRLYPDMLPFRFQVQSVVHHSVGTIEALKAGCFRPPRNLPQSSYVELQALVAGAKLKMQAVKPDEVNALAGKDMVFEFGERRIPFTAEGFVLSFSLPNFYFHATTAYDILRSKGVPIGKRDYLGRLRLKS